MFVNTWLHRSVWMLGITCATHGSAAEPVAVDAPASAVTAPVAVMPKVTAALPPIQITALDGTSTADQTQVNIHFDRKPSFEAFTLEAHGTFLQIPLAHSQMSKPGEFVNVQSPFVNKLVGFQHADDRSSVRLFVNQEASLVKQAMENETVGNMISLKLDHKRLGKLIANDPSTTAQPPSVPTAAEVVAATTVVAEPAPAPAELIKAEKPEANSAAAAAVVTTTVGRKDKQPGKAKAASAIAFRKADDLNGKMTKAAIFCAIMFFGLIVVYLSKPYMRKRLGGKRGQEAELAGLVMKTLATQRVNAKQRIELMEVAGEKILLAISGDQVNYLTTLPRASVPNHGLQPSAESALTLNSTRSLPQRQTLQPKNLVEQKPRANPAPAVQTRSAVTEASAKQQTLRERQRVQVEVGDEIKMSYEKKSEPKDAISDVTRLIREKLKSLPSI